MKQNRLNVVICTEWEWFQRTGKPWYDWIFQGMIPSVATIWQHFFRIHRKRANWFWLGQLALFVVILRIVLGGHPPAYRSGPGIWAWHALVYWKIQDSGNANDHGPPADFAPGIERVCTRPPFVYPFQLCANFPFLWTCGASVFKTDAPISILVYFYVKNQ